jgi:hypothetical protein
MGLKKKNNLVVYYPKPTPKILARAMDLFGDENWPSFLLPILKTSKLMYLFYITLEVYTILLIVSYAHLCARKTHIKLLKSIMLRIIKVAF